MDNIVSEDGYVIGTIKHLQLLRYLAEEKIVNSGRHFDESDYKWKLGAKVWCNIVASYDSYITNIAFDTKPTLFGIDVELDYVNPENVQLWRNITDEL